MTAVGERAPAFALPDTSGHPHSLGGAPATAVVFTCNHCPYALAWHERLIDAARDFAPRGAVVLLWQLTQDRRWLDARVSRCPQTPKLQVILWIWYPQPDLNRCPSAENAVSWTGLDDGVAENARAGHNKTAENCALSRHPEPVSAVHLPSTPCAVAVISDRFADPEKIVAPLCVQV